MKSIIENTFEKLKNKDQAALIPYIPVGYPNLKETVEYINTITEAGADIIELGVPCSDPLADGPIIQEASKIALSEGVTLKKCIEVVKQVRKSGNNIPIALMGYCNSFLAYNFKNFVVDANEVGVNALIIPDLPPEMAEDWINYARNHNINIIFFLSPSSDEERIDFVTKSGSGFIYCIAVMGITGERDNLPEALPNFMKKIRPRTKLPLAIGFGISHPSHVASVSKYADGAIVGSALIRLIKETPPQNRLGAVSNFIKALKESTKLSENRV
ncbi:tryptophan synthase subunit alpha [Bacillus cereus]|uniref:tryptophan synthase subunit alpha n=1 Tax=Bacillus TaxID=1386 RepID=UPI00054E7554|nr:tryptophan synthase subunit alpha [Bacillus sp. UNC322MFChir4.1]